MPSTPLVTLLTFRRLAFDLLPVFAGFLLPDTFERFFAGGDDALFIRCPFLDLLAVERVLRTEPAFLFRAITPLVQS